MDWVERRLPAGARVVCFSDVHGNRAALDTVIARADLARADLVVVNGDVVNRGPCSDAVWDRLAALRDDRWIIGSGNHERYVRRHEDPESAPSGRLAEVHASSAFAYRQMGDRVRALFGLPDAVRVRVEGLPELRVLHASMAGDDVGVAPETEPEAARHRVGVDGAVVVVGHLHRCYDFRVGATRVVNAGSVGSSCDGVRLAGWVELIAGGSAWDVRVHRVPYDIEATEEDFWASGFLEGAGPVARLIHREWQLARPVVRPWFRAELDRVLSGAISLERSVSGFLARFAPERALAGAG